MLLKFVELEAVSLKTISLLILVLFISLEEEERNRETRLENRLEKALIVCSQGCLSKLLIHQRGRD
jgi:hypothetical protein